MLSAGAALAALAVTPGRVRAQAGGDSLPSLPELRRLVAANRILAHEGVVDAFGHVSVRDPRDAKRSGFKLSNKHRPQANKAF